MKLLFREDKYSDELFDDYVSRISVLNGFENEKKFVKRLYAEFRCQYGDCLGGNFKERKRLALEWILKKNIEVEDDSYKYRPWEISFRRGEDLLKVCEECLNTKRYVRFYWREHWYERCHIHKCGLMACESIWDSKKRVSICDEDGCQSSIEYRFVEKAISLFMRNGAVIDSTWKEYLLIDQDVDTISTVARLIEESFNIDLKENVLIRKIKHGLVFNKDLSDRSKVIVSSLSKNHPQLKPLITFLFVVDKINNQNRPPYPKLYWAAGSYSDWAKNEVFALEEVCSLWASLKLNPLDPKRELPDLKIWGIDMIPRFRLVDMYYRIQDIDRQFTERIEPWVYMDEMKSENDSKYDGILYEKAFMQAYST